MNKNLETYARGQLVEKLALLPESHHRVFRLMYGRKPDRRGIATRTVEEACALDLGEVVAEMPADKLDWAMTQVDTSLAEIAATVKS